MSNVISVEFPRNQGPRTVEVEWRIRAYDKSSLNLVEVTETDEADAITTSRRLFSQGYDITVRKHLIEHVVDWVYDADWQEG
jgi:hypothetical protein